MVISPESNDMNGAENDGLWESGQEEHSFPVISCWQQLVNSVMCPNFLL